MSSICYVTEDQLRSDSRLSDFRPISKSLSRENVATIIETFEFAIKEIDSDIIKDVLINNNGYVLFLVDPNGVSNFDFYDFLNKKYKGSVGINCMNAKWMFPKGLSKGIYLGYDDSPIEEDTEKTGYLDEGDIQEILGNSNPILRCRRTNATIIIPKEGITLGRTKTADYYIADNINISRTHCKLYIKGGVVYIHDCNSSNGTYVNGIKVYSNKDVPVNVNDTIMLADEEFTLIG